MAKDIKKLPRILGREVINAACSALRLGKVDSLASTHVLHLELDFDPSKNTPRARLQLTDAIVRTDEEELVRRPWEKDASYAYRREMLEASRQRYNLGAIRSMSSNAEDVGCIAVYYLWSKTGCYLRTSAPRRSVWSIADSS